MSAVLIVIKSVFVQLCFQIRGCPKQEPVQTLASNGSNQSLDERVRPWNVRNRFDFCDAEDSQIRFPLMKPIQRIMIGAEIPWKSRHASDGLLEHVTQCFTVNNA